MPSAFIVSGKDFDKAYSPPKLTIYGSAKTLTASGTGAQQESVQGGGPSCSSNTSRRPC